jgi:protein involved in polysaccharide export with SLBB domain
MLAGVYARALAGQTVTFRPRGSSMTGLVDDGAEVVVAPCHPARLEPGDVVLVKVAGTVYLHKVSAVDPGRSRVQIANNRGRVNGWAGWAKVAGICVAVNGRPRPATTGKVRDTPPGP